MGLFEKIGLIERIEEPLVDDISYEIDDIETDITVSVPEDTVNLKDLYESNGMVDTTTSIFKVEEIRKGLPNEMVTSTKRDTVINTLGIFGIDVQSIEDDANKRLVLLNEVYEKIDTDSTKYITDHETQIENLKKEIARLETEIADKKNNTKYSLNVLSVEAERINELKSFLKGEN